MAATACLLAAGCGAFGHGSRRPAPVAPAPTAPVAVEPLPSRTDTASAQQRPRTLARAQEDSAARRAAADSAKAAVTGAEVVREVTRVFGDSMVPPATDSVTAPGAPVWDIDVHSYETRDRVEHFVQLFSGAVREPFVKSLQRQTRYGPLIRQKLREGGLPEDMTYLALIESWYDPNAYSRAAAVGMWQFMAGTARGMGLRVDWWVDERRDPVRSTAAAARLLRALRDQFGSLYLAAAAYDGGDGRISRGLARYAGSMEGVEGEDRFFALADTKYLRPETRDYVPKLIAAALVGKDPVRYGVVFDSLPPFTFDTVRVAGGSSLAAIANAAATDVATLRDLNPHVLRGMTPPGESFCIRVPTGTAAAFGERFSALEPGERAGVKRVETKKGESMTSIAKKQGITAKQLGWFNPKVTRLKSGNLAAGQPILVPSRATVAAALDVPNPSIERYPKRSRAVASRTHVVTRGETLDGIAKRYGTSAATLMKLNGLRKPLLVPGQSLVVKAAPAKAR